MARETIRVEGLRELDRALGELPKATGKAVLRRVSKDALEPTAALARDLAPRDEGHLGASITVAAKLTRRQGAQQRKSNKSTVEMHAGPGGLPQATAQEFGTLNHPPQPFMRPAWDATRHEVLDHVASELGAEITKAAKRLARKAARLRR